MATKSSLISTINGYITSVVTVLKVRNAFSSIINELFQTTTTYSLETGTNVFRYKLRFKKIGNIVFLDGYITNKYTTPQSALNIYIILILYIMAKLRRYSLRYSNNKWNLCKYINKR